MFQAYLITYLPDGRQYVGITSRSIKQRWNEHVYDARSARTGMVVSRAIKKYGAEHFTIESICCACSWDDLCAVESALVEQLDCKAPRGFNVSNGGEGPFGVMRSAESVERSAAKHRGLPCHENTRGAAVRTHKGKPKSAEHCAKIAAARTGTTRTDATKEKLRQYWAKRRSAGEFKTAEPYANYSKSNARKAASAMIAKIPLPLSRHIAAYWKPRE